MKNFTYILIIVLIGLLSTTTSFAEGDSTKKTKKEQTEKVETNVEKPTLCGEPFPQTFEEAEEWFDKQHSKNPLSNIKKVETVKCDSIKQ